MSSLSDWSAYAPDDDGLPSSPSALRNRYAILEQLRPLLPAGARLLEIASGTGEHVTHFASALPHVTFQPTDVDLAAMGLRKRLAKAELANIEMPFALDVSRWPNLRKTFDCVLSINCVHIAPARLLPDYVKGAAGSLRSGGRMVLYGPFRRGGQFDTESNAAFDVFLQDTYPGGGIRDLETVDALAASCGMTLEIDAAMPANNRFVAWRKRDDATV